MLFYGIHILFNNFGNLSKKIVFDKCKIQLLSVQNVCFILTVVTKPNDPVFIDKMRSEPAAYSVLEWNVETLYHNCIAGPSLPTVVSIMHPHIMSIILYIPVLLAIGALSPSQSFVSSHLFFTLLKHNVSI